MYFKRFYRIYDRIQIVILKKFTAQLKTYNIFFLQKNLNKMKKTIGKLVVAVQAKSSGFKRSSGTISKYVNKVPCNKQELNKPTQADIFINEEMREYPLPPKNKPSKRELLFSEKLKMRLQSNQKYFNKLISKLQQKLTFFELQQMRQLLQFMTEKQIDGNKTGLKKLKYVVNYFLESSQQNILLQDHVSQAAIKLIEEIKEAQKKKVNLIV